MATDTRRFTVSATHSMDMELDKAKRETHYKDTQDKTIRNLIVRELQDSEAEKAAKEDGCERVS